MDGAVHRAAGAMKHEIEVRDRVFIVTTSGETSAKGFAEAFRAIFTHPDWKPGMGLLLDNRKLVNAMEGSLSYGDVSKAVSSFSRFGQQAEGLRIASILPLDQELKPYFRLWHSTTKYFNMPVERKKLQGIEEALEWLMSPAPGA